MNFIQSALEKAIIIFKFIWRHIFTISVFGLLWLATIKGKGIYWTMFFQELTVAIIIDWLKMKFKFKSSGAHSNDFFERPPGTSSTTFTRSSEEWNYLTAGTLPYYNRLNNW